MTQTTITVKQTSPAGADEVWRLLADVSTWPSWAPVRRAHLEAEGSPSPDGVGAIRQLRTMTGVTRERVVAFDAPARFGYELLSGLPLRAYRSEVTISARRGGGSMITWRSTFDAPNGVRGRFWRAFVRATLRTFSRRLAAAASRSSGGRQPVAAVPTATPPGGSSADDVTPDQRNATPRA